MATQTKAYHEVLQTTYGLDFLVAYIEDTGSLVPKHFHDALEVVYMLDGEGLMMADGRLMVAGPDEILLANPRVIHHSTAPYGNENILLQYPSQLVGRMVENAEELELLVPTEMAMTPAQQAAWARIKAAGRALQQIFKAPRQKNHNLQLSLRAMEVLDNLYTHFSVPRAKQSFHKKQSLDKLGPVLDYMEEHYTEPISIEEIAAVVSLQPEYFCRFFKKCTGSTFLEHLNALRISYIYNDLVNTDAPISQILDKHGFTNYKVFSRMFKERFGGSPREIRGRIRERRADATGFDTEFRIRQIMNYEGQWPGLWPAGTKYNGKQKPG